MLTVIVTSFDGLLELFVAVPLVVVAGIYGAEGAARLRRGERLGKRV